MRVFIFCLLTINVFGSQIASELGKVDKEKVSSKRLNNIAASNEVGNGAFYERVISDKFTLGGSIGSIPFNIIIADEDRTIRHDLRTYSLNTSYYLSGALQTGFSARAGIALLSYDELNDKVVVFENKRLDKSTKDYIPYLNVNYNWISQKYGFNASLGLRYVKYDYLLNSEFGTKLSFGYAF